MRRLDRRGLVLGVAALGFAVMLGGLLASPHPYGSVDFVVDFFAAELVLAAVLLGAVLAAFPASRLGLGAPRGIEPRRVAPLALLLAAATFDLARFAVAGAGHGPALALGGIALAPGVWSAVRLRSLDGPEPYAR